MLSKVNVTTQGEAHCKHVNKQMEKSIDHKILPKISEFVGN